MAAQLRPNGVRAPISDQQYAAGETYYTKDDLKRIFRSFEAKPNTDLDWLEDEIERCAWIYVAFSHHRPRSIEPSERKRRLNSFRKRAEAFLAAAEAVGANLRVAEDIRGAAEALAKRDGLPDFGPELIRYESIPPGDPVCMAAWHWAAEKQIKKTHEGLRWFVHVLQEAEARVQKDIRPAGNRADLPQHQFVCGIERVYQKTALEPRRPNFDAISEEERGELLDLLTACLLPLGVNMSRSALLGLYRRATERT